jgi:phenylalanyl-tRNA synthetase beta chain
VLAGRSAPSSWRGGEAPLWDLFAAKGVVGALLDTLRVAWDVRPEAPHPFLHPGRSARVYAGEVELGWVGEVHPLVAQAWELETNVAAFELDLGLAVDQAPAIAQFRDVTSFPAVRQDLALVVGDDVPAATVLATIRKAGGKLLESAEVFDVFRGAQIGEGKVSLAIHLAFRAPDRTLTDEETGRLVDKMLAALAELGGRAAWLSRPSSSRAPAATRARSPRSS